MTQTVLIETLWNVNDDCLEYGLIDKVVLIETLWNVNYWDSSRCWKWWSYVLIETLWNVNQKQLTVILAEYQRINRNIVECKLYSAWVRSARVTVLIETLWNVNLHDTHRLLQQVPVLIETLWNVNWKTLQSSNQTKSINRNIVECKLLYTLFLTLTSQY